MIINHSTAFSSQDSQVTVCEPEEQYDQVLVTYRGAIYGSADMVADEAAATAAANNDLVEQRL